MAPVCMWDIGLSFLRTDGCCFLSLTFEQAVQRRHHTPSRNGPWATLGYPVFEALLKQALPQPRACRKRRAFSPELKILPNAWDKLMLESCPAGGVNPSGLERASEQNEVGMKPEIGQHYETIRKVLRTLRVRGAICVGVMLLSVPAVALLTLAGVPIRYAVLSLYVGAGAFGYLLFLFGRSLDRIQPFRCECERNVFFFNLQNSIWRDWVCGFCANAHTDSGRIKPWWRTLVDPCKKCLRRQHSFLCVECGQPIVWDEEAYLREPGTSAWHPRHPPTAVPEDRPRG
jgi:hypothetical protein